MQKIKETLAVVLILYIAAGIFIMFFQLLFRHAFPRSFGYTLLVALALLKGTLIGLRCHHQEQELTKSERSGIITLLQIGLALFCLTLFIAFSLKGQQLLAFMAFISLLASAFRTKLINPFTDTNS